MTTTATAAQEAAIERMVRLFYERGLEDEVLGPIFRASIHDWEAHIPIVASFWSSMIHGTQRYQGNAFGAHMNLKFEPHAFDRIGGAFLSVTAH